jgi:hypothetical protein
MGILYFALNQDFENRKSSIQILTKVVLEEKKRKQGLDCWMKNKPMVLGLLKGMRVLPKGLG